MMSLFGLAISGINDVFNWNRVEVMNGLRNREVITLTNIGVFE